MLPACRVSPLVLAASLLVCSACDKGPTPDRSAAGERAAGASAAEPDKPAAEPAPEASDELHPDDAQLADRRSKDQLAHDVDAIQRAHDEMAALLAEARALVEAGDATGSLAKYEALLALDPHHRPALLELGAAEAKAENWAAAVHHLKLAAKLTDHADASKASIFDQIGQHCERLDKPDDAAHYYRESLKLAASPDVQGRLDALGDVAPELEPPAGPADSVDGLHHHTALVGSAKDVCSTYGDDGLCVAESCEFITGEGDDSWGVFEVGDGTTNCYHPAIRVGEDSWAVYDTALMDSHGVEVHQSVDRLELAVVEAEGGPYLVIRYADHLYERVWDDELAGELPTEDTIDSEGMIVCQRVGDKTRCTEPLITSLDFAIGAQTGKFSAKIGFGQDAVVVSDVVKQGKADAAIRTYFHSVLLDPGPHTLPKAF